MVERQARSKMSSDEAANRLKKLVGGRPNKPVSTAHTTKLPSIRQPSDVDLLIL